MLFLDHSVSEGIDILSLKSVTDIVETNIFEIWTEIDCFITHYCPLTTVPVDFTKYN